MTSEASRDFRTAAAQAAEKGDAEAAAEEAASHTQGGIAFLRRATVSAASSANPDKPAKRFRKKAYEWFLVAEIMLQVSAGLSLLFFVVADAATKLADAAVWPVLSACIDQGSDGWAATACLKHHLRLNLFGVPRS